MVGAREASSGRSSVNHPRFSEGDREGYPYIYIRGPYRENAVSQKTEMHDATRARYMQ